jgi:DNA-binding NarL/FixJ family response regulator
MSPLRVAVQSTDPLMRELLGEWLRRHPRVGAVVLAADGAELSRLCGTEQPDAVIVDAMDADDKSADKKPDQPAPANAGKRSAGHPTSPTRGLLTCRELDVLRQLSHGRRSSQVGAQLGVSARTVENHKRRIFAKLGVHSETQAVAEAIRLGLLRGRPPARWARLTPRETEILELAAAGHSVKQTARVLNISIKTVESIQSHLFRKLGVSGRTGAVAAVYGYEDARVHPGT